MDDDTRAAIEAVWARIRRLSEMHEVEWKTAARWRDQWGAELDALIAEVSLLTADIRELQRKHTMTQPSQSERIMAAVRNLTSAFSDILFDLLPPEKEPLKARFNQVLGDLLAEVIGGASVMAAGAVVGVDQKAERAHARIDELARQVGGDGKR